MVTVSTHAAAVPAATYFAFAIGGILFGFDTAVINGAVLALKSYLNTTSVLIGLSVSLALVGAAVGAFFAEPVADQIGRMRCMLIASVLFLVGAIGSGASVDIWDLVFWRSLGGIAIGGAIVIARGYIAEVSPAETRWALPQQLAIVVGIFLALLSNFALVDAAGRAEAPLWFGFEAWRWMFWSEAVPAFAYCVCSLFILESPRYLVKQKLYREALQVLDKMLPSEIIGGDRKDAGRLIRLKEKAKEIRCEISQERKPRWSDLRDKWGLLSIVWIGIGLSVFQQFVGINVIFYYGSALWRIVGFTEKCALMIMIITGVINIIATLVGIALIDKFGRKPLLLLGSLGMVVTLGIMAWVFGTSPVDAESFLSENAKLAAVFAANLYVFCFGFSWGPVVWVLLGEMFKNMIWDERALALSVAVQWIANFIVSTTFPPITYNLGLGVAYGLYAAFAALSLIFVIAFIGETKGKKLEEMNGGEQHA